MRLNTAKSLKLARRVKGQYGTWQAVRKAARVENGVYVVEQRAPDDEAAPKDRLRPVTA